MENVQLFSHNSVHLNPPSMLINPFLSHLISTLKEVQQTLVCKYSIIKCILDEDLILEVPENFERLGGNEFVDNIVAWFYLLPLILHRVSRIEANVSSCAFIVHMSQDDPTWRQSHLNLFYLLQTIQYMAKNRVVQTETRELASLNRGKIKPGETDDWRNEQLYVPPLPPTNLRGCHIIRIQYDVFVSIFHFLISFKLKFQVSICCFFLSFN